MKNDTEKTNPNFDTLTELELETLCVPVTYKTDASGMKRFSFSILRKIRRGEEVIRTHWVQRHHLGYIKRLLDQVEQILAAEEEKANLAGRSVKG